ncbi:hypothetical protein ABK040_013123 [Willaertia magna]
MGNKQLKSVEEERSIYSNKSLYEQKVALIKFKQDLVEHLTDEYFRYFLTRYEMIKELISNNGTANNNDFLQIVDKCYNVDDLEDLLEELKSTK